LRSAEGLEGRKEELMNRYKMLLWRVRCQQRGVLIALAHLVMKKW
jgi:hypothetical protein